MNDQALPAHMVSHWERALQVLDGKWTHWALYGDGTLLAYVSGTDLFEVLQLLREHHDKWDRIRSVRARLLTAKDYEEEAGYDATIWRHMKNSVLGLP